MRYAIITYIRRPNGQIDENLEVATRTKKRDIQMANVIMDFKDQKVVKCTIDGINGVSDWDTVVSYYYPHYQSTFERLFQENGHMLTRENNLIAKVDEK